jgi:uncharacterized membrane protein YphA (DoxX/SURF4 family)
MSDADLVRVLPRALLVLRVSLALFFLQWGVEKFVVPENTPAIWGHFYGVAIPAALGFVFGVVEIALAIGLLVGRFLTAAVGAALVFHSVSVLVSWRQLIDPWGEPANHLFVAGIPVLGALIALFLLRRWAGVGSVTEV